MTTLIRSIKQVNEQYMHFIHGMRIAFFGLILAIVGAIATYKFGLLAIPMAGGLLVIVAILFIGYKFWWKMLVFVLFGYMFLSRGFASIGFHPVFIGEITLSLGLITLLIFPFSDKIKLVSLKRLRQPEVIIILIMLGWNLARTLPYIGAYQFDALRDAMLYGYSIYALLIVALIPKDRIEGFFRLYGKAIPFVVAWSLPLLLNSHLQIVTWAFPGSPFPFIYSKGSDIGVHLAGIVAFMLLQLDQIHTTRPRWATWLMWITWGISTIFYSSLGRALLLCAAASVGIVLMMRPLQSRWDRPLLMVVMVLCLMLITNTYTAEIDIGNHRVISAEQLVANVSSIFGIGDNSQGSLEGTKQWRLHWWDAIINYTFHGPYFWTGKGYGVNLANSDGFQVLADESLRSPHNGHLTYLARGGVPALVIWFAFLGVLTFRLLRFALLKFRSHPLQARYAVWLFAYLFAHMLMTSFDVFIEGPMGGIWFWALVGMSIAYFTNEEKPASRKFGLTPQQQSFDELLHLKTKPPLS